MASRHILTAPAAVTLLAALAACAPADEPGPSASASASASAVACAPGALPTRTPGKLTFATDNPAYEPWFVGNKPENGQGFEGAVARAVADRLGYAPPNTVWIRVGFNNAIAPGPKAFDVDVNEFSITPERQLAVDFSTPYYLVRQAVITTKGSKIAAVTTIAGLADAKLGAQVGTTSYQAVTDVVRPKQQAQVYNNNDDAKAALQNGQIDGLVVDLPTAFYITSAELDDGVIVGQLPQTGVPEQFGMVLDKGSPLTACVSQAVDALRADGTLAELERRWLAGANGARELT